jgi:rubrerythrin
VTLHFAAAILFFEKIRDESIKNKAIKSITKKGENTMAQGKSIIDFAMTQEREGMTFYNKASRKFEDKALKKLFAKLAGEEKKHLESFKSLKAKVQKKNVDENFRSTSVDEYLEALIKEGIFPKDDVMSKQIDKIKSVADVCAIAMKAEKDAILLYSELAKASTDKEQKKMFTQLVKEEKSHIAMVSAVRADYDPAYAAMKFGRFF